ncbi:TRAP transporter small permease subunit (plasmid) [Paroceanicella profunda]|uniref:TRAP transporter small permease protein n=1 Tax=Paroceanicella profunda TaxID=2579971 RepID=A0A5B8FZL8_9RHOB|nr:TRAP transporter small permease subunit [Paroceanicella profunda]QDL94356.1 TRAP transporter small permease subunit [Paroceanicella profunda]
MFRRMEYAVAAALLVAVVVLIGAASVARVRGTPIIWSVEVAQLLFAWLAMLAADLALQDGRHFGLALLPDLLPPAARRWLLALNGVVIAGLLGFLLVYAWRNMVLMHPRLVGATQMHGSLIHGSMVLGLALMLRTMLAQILSGLRAKDTR